MPSPSRCPAVSAGSAPLGRALAAAHGTLALGRVLLFVPRWLGDDGGPKRVPHQLGPVLGAIQFAGWRVTLVEEAFDGLPDGAFVAAAAQHDAVVVWCAEMYPATQIPGIRAALAARDAQGRPPIVGGGFFQLARPEALGLEQRALAVVHGPGEVCLPQALAALVDGAAPPISGVLWLSGSRRDPVGRPPKPPRTMPGEWLGVLADLGLERYDHGESLVFDSDRPAVQVATASGCAKRCRFCFDHRNPLRVYPADAVVASVLGIVAREGIDQFLFGELDFFHDPSRALAIAQGLVGRGVRWFALGSIVDVARLADGDLDLLRRSGCHRIELGTESGSDRQLAQFGKGHRRAQALRQAERLAAHGIRVTHNILFGAPGELASDRRATLRLVRQLARLRPRPHFNFRIYQIIPQTPMGEEALRSVAGFPETLDQLSDYRLHLQASDRGLPWLRAREERWIRAIHDYLGPIAFHRQEGALRILGLAGRVRLRLGLLAGIAGERRLADRLRMRRATTFVP